MLNTFLVSEQAVDKNGEGPTVELGEHAGRKLLLTLRLTRIIEQESLDVSVWGSEDGVNFPAQLTAFPQSFYTGTQQLPLDLTGQPNIRSVRVKWEVNRWGRGEKTPRFTFSLAIEELLGGAAA
jgi:hypothetical protein